MTTKEITTYQKPTSELVERARALTIDSPAAMTEATTLLSTFNKYLDSVVKYKEKKTRPLNEALKVIRAETKPIETELESLIASLRDGMGAYQTEQKRLEAEASAKIADRVSRGTLKVETGIAKLEALDRPEEAINTEVGTVKFRTSRILKIVDKALIPIEYYELDEARLLSDLKAGKVVPGATTEEIQTAVNYR